MHDLVLVLEPLCEQHSFSCHESHKQVCYIFKFSFFLVKTGDNYADYENFLDIKHRLQENVP